ncbi:MAG: response regulator [Deltaproteobacteria bacterium]|nr:response regulator [Deltaproteobacteria bacterium]
MSSIAPLPEPAEVQSLRAEIRQIEDRFTSFIDSESESIFCYEPDMPIPVTLPAREVAQWFLNSKLAVANKTFARLRNEVDPQVFIGRPMRELARENLDRVASLIEQLIESANKRQGAEVKQMQPDGSIRYALSNAHLVQSNGCYTRLWVILRDITEQKRLQAEHEALQIQLRQAQRMESLGLLAGGIAHDFNNLLVVIENCAQFAGDDMESNPAEARESLRQIEDASARAAALVRSLMAFARPSVGAMRTVYLDSLVLDLTAMLRRLIPARISLTTRLLSSNAIKADVVQIEQVMVNLVINAVDAIDDVGEITIGTSNLDPSPRQRALYPWVQEGPFVRLCVTDNGRGIAPDVRTRLFEPFFTTKPEGKGNGLGLSVVWGAVKRHGGFVDIETGEDAQGTRFCVFLPQAPDRGVQTTPVPLFADAPLGSETILVADDHELVRNVTKDVLERAGYKVILALDGEDAIRTFSEKQAVIDAVILDAIMPKVSGFVAHEQIRQMRPNVPIMVASGHTRDVFPEDWPFREGSTLLSKPFRSEELLRALRALLDAKRG